MTSARSEPVQSAFRAESQFSPFVQSVQTVQSILECMGRVGQGVAEECAECSVRLERSEHGQFFGSLLNGALHAPNSSTA
jgi:hypothetical protein